MRDKNILITGGLGFIGSHIANTLLENNNIVILDNLTTGNINNLNNPDNENLKIVKEDIRNINLDDLTSDIDYVFHLAAMASVPLSIDKPVECSDINLNATIKLLESCVKNDVEKIIFSSSSSVYGPNKNMPLKESEQPMPKSPYAASKASCELYLKAFNDSYGLNYTSLRYFNVFGPGQDKNSQYAAVIPNFISSILEGVQPEIYGDYQMETKDMYLGMTRKVAKDFERKLLNRLQIAFDDFNKEISEFISKLLVCQDKLEAEIVARKMENALPNLQDMVVEVREPMKIANFEHKLLTDQGKMRSLASKTRETLTGGRKFVHFRDIAQSMDENSLIEIADEHLTQMVIDWHNSDETFSRDKVIGMNVIEQLEKFFANNPQENIKTFAKKIIDQSGIFLKLNDKEIKKTKTNTEGPDIGRTIKKEFMLISMPDCEDSSKLKQFREELKTAFKESVENPDFMKFDEEGSKDNEISIVRIVSCIPMRCLDWLPVYKDKYDAMINVENEMTRRQNRILLHSEGDGSELPLLEGEGEGPKGNQLIPYLLIDAALEKSIRWGVDKREEEGWCKAVVDFLGNAELELIATKFTEIMLSEKFTVDLKNQIVDEVEKYLKNEDLTQGMRKTLVEKIMDLVKNKIVPEIGVGTTAYKEYLAATEEAVKTITKK